MVKGIQEPQVCFFVKRVQRHELATYADTRIHRMYAEKFEVTPPEDNPCLSLYNDDLVMDGILTWGVHLNTVSRHQGLWRSSKDVFTLCNMPNEGTHLLNTCPLKALSPWYLTVKMSLWLPEVVLQWEQCIHTPWGVWVQRGGTTFVLATRFPRGLVASRVPLVVCNEGGVSPQMVKLMCKAGATENRARRIFRSGIFRNIPEYPEYPE